MKQAMSNEFVKRKLYLITLLPPAEIQADVKRFKEEIKEKFKAQHALKLPAHITLQRPFWVMDEQRDLLYRDLGNFVASRTPFTVQLKDFGCFTPRVIYVDVANPKPIIEFQQALQAALSDSVFLRSRERQIRPITPHMTVATRDLKKEVFPQAWDDFKTRHYSAQFSVDAVTLFQHDGKYWHSLAEFPF